MEEPMSRTLVIALGVVLWTSFAIVSIVHVAMGDPVGPILAVIIVGTGVAMWHARQMTLTASRANELAQADLDPRGWSAGGGFPPASD
jgi:hypothetical protein